jgi:hypothetical protein
LTSQETPTPSRPTSDLVYDNISQRRLEFLKTTVCRGADESAIASFLEVAHQYDLSPFNGEIWLVTNKTPGRDGGAGQTKSFVMVGRNGLRKVAANNKMVLHGDVIREADSLDVSFTAGAHTVLHSYGKPADRGKIVAAWAQVTDIKSGLERGWFMADIEEYRPKSEQKLKFSPWGSQESVMILGAAERTALRQAVPLGGLLTEGEVELGQEVAEAAATDLSYLDAPTETEPAHQPQPQSEK